jgi:hypothetical protein
MLPGLLTGAGVLIKLHKIGIFWNIAAGPRPRVPQTGGEGGGDNFIKLHKIRVFSRRITQGVSSGIHGRGQFAFFGDGQVIWVCKSAFKAVSQLLWSDKNREEWFSLGENHEKACRSPDFLRRSTSREQLCATFFTERRMEFHGSTNLHRKSGFGLHQLRNCSGGKEKPAKGGMGVAG